MENNYTIDKLCEIVNKKLAIEGSQPSDSRMAKELTVRRVRDYLGKNLISKPVKIGKQNFFSDVHVDELVRLRNLQASGFSEKSIISSSAIAASIKNPALEAIEKIKSRDNPAFGASLSPSMRTQALRSFLDDDQALYGAVNSEVSLAKTFKEYPLNSNGGVSLKVADGEILNSKELISNLKDLLNKIGG